MYYVGYIGQKKTGLGQPCNKVILHRCLHVLALVVNKMVWQCFCGGEWQKSTCMFVSDCVEDNSTAYTLMSPHPHVICSGPGLAPTDPLANPKGARLGQTAWWRAGALFVCLRVFAGEKGGQRVTTGRVLLMIRVGQFFWSHETVTMVTILTVWQFREDREAAQRRRLPVEEVGWAGGG